MNISVDPHAVDKLIRSVAEQHILPRFRRLAGHEVKEKSPGNLVTIADLEAEQALTPALTAMLPGALVVGEEAVANDPGTLDRLYGDAPVWIIDPVDGTINFANSNPRFAVIIALVARGELLAGWIHDPVWGVTAAALAGQGAWRLEPDGRRQHLRCAEPPPLQNLRGAASGRLGDRGRIRDILRNSGRVGPLQWIKSAGQEYLDLVEGNLDYTVFARTLPWDHAAGVLIHREAGGVSGFLDGPTPDAVPYSPRRHHGPLLIAPTAALWSALRGIMLHV